MNKKNLILLIALSSISFFSVSSEVSVKTVASWETKAVKVSGVNVGNGSEIEDLSNSGLSSKISIVNESGYVVDASTGEKTELETKTLNKVYYWN